jgi:queuine tRNA-ribosyltransferase
LISTRPWPSAAAQGIPRFIGYVPTQRAESKSAALIIAGMFEFNVEAQSGRARAGSLNTPHGALYTPVFAPVGTQATVKSMTPRQLKECGASLVLANTYHLYLRPGDELVDKMGGLHRFMSWPGPILTDSGGYQVFSLAQTRRIDDDGVTFKSHIDGSTHRITPERATAIQEHLGADIVMALDECSDPNDRGYSATAMHRTHRWAERCLRAHKRADQAMFGIVQGGIDGELREESAHFIAGLNTPGIAIGGLSVGESKAEMHAMLDVVTAALPEHKPRYLMGVGTPEDLLDGISRGVDIFDCVLPTRLARHHAAFTSTGRLNAMNAAFAMDDRAIDDACDCYTCGHFSRAYIRHLIVAREMLAATLLSIHNIRALVRLVQNIRSSILDGTFEVRLPDWLGQWHGNAVRV